MGHPHLLGNPRVGHPPIHYPRQRACSLRHRQPREVALQQPKVAAQLPTGGDVSTPLPMPKAWHFSLAAPMLLDGATDANKPPRRTAFALVILQPELLESVTSHFTELFISSTNFRPCLAVVDQGLCLCDSRSHETSN